MIRAMALLLVALLIPSTFAEVVIDPSKKPGADPLFRIFRSGSWGYMDRTGKTVIEPRFGGGRDFFRGLAGVCTKDGCGYIDHRGRFVIPPQFDDVRDFLGELAPVRIGRKWGYIDTSGRMVVQPRFQAAAEFHEGLARVHVWEKIVCVSGEYTSETAPIWAFRLSEDDHSVLPDCFTPVGGRFGFIDTSGGMVIEPSFYYAQDFFEGLAVVRIEGTRGSKSGYIDRSGSLVIPPVFNQAEPFSEGLAAVETSLAWGFIDRSGKLVIPDQYGFTGKFSDGRAWVAVDPDWNRGYIDRTGRMVIAPQFTMALDFSEGLAVACGDGCAFIDRSGRPVISRPGVRWPFSDGLAVLVLRPPLYIDKHGRGVAPYALEK